MGGRRGEHGGETVGVEGGFEFSGGRCTGDRLGWCGGGGERARMRGFGCAEVADRGGGGCGIRIGFEASMGCKLAAFCHGNANAVAYLSGIIQAKALSVSTDIKFKPEEH